jgi:hypothetical protein
MRPSRLELNKTPYSRRLEPRSPRHTKVIWCYAARNQMHHLHVITCDYCMRCAASPRHELVQMWLRIHLALCMAAKRAAQLVSTCL